ncbi:type 1 glutamine amidotransferase [Methanolobus sp. ZRKC2]|uniref:type 1 glutamine amidotransferase n=1 Tax=Methanolobus sp. ZRKC2 TaxID=3125783 RepID=UPI00324D8732
MRIHCLQHLEFETLGNINQWVCGRGHTLSRSLPYASTLFPQLDDLDLLIIMGGLMSVYEEDSYPWLKLEKKFVKKCLNEGKAVLGICFGAQMLAEILGSRVSRNEYKEIGWHKVKTIDGNGKFALSSGFPEEFTALQWHGDTFALPENTVRLFESEACREQGFIFRDNVLAVQFHPEVDERCIQDLVENCRSDLVYGRYIQNENDIVDRPDFIEGSASLMFYILDWFESIHLNKTDLWNPGKNFQEEDNGR